MVSDDDNETTIELNRLQEECINDDINDPNVSNYTMRYRVIKTILLIFTWISYGMEAESFGPALQDLKVQLNTNYQGMTRLLIARYLTCTCTMCIYGILLKKFVKYSEIIISISELSLALICFTIPWTRTYWIMFLLFLVEGVSQTVLDVTGSTLVLRLWKGVSNSPIIVVYGGYSIGGGTAVLLFKQFIKFNTIPTHSQTQYTNNSRNFSEITSLKPDDIRLHLPYSILGLYMFLIAISCFIAYFIERHQIKYFNKDGEENGEIEKLKAPNNDTPKKSFRTTISKYLFDEDLKENRIFNLKCFQITLIFLICVCFGAFASVFTSFQFSYLTNGPAKIPINTTTFMLTIYWFVIFTGRLMSTFIAYKISPLVFYLVILLLTMGLLSLSTIPLLNCIKLFHWIFMLTIGLPYGPIKPGIIMVANHVLMKPSPLIVSIILFGCNIGNIIAQYMSGIVLDNFKPHKTWLGYKNPTSLYVLPFVSCSLLLCGILIYFVLLLTYIKAKSLKKKNFKK